MLPTFALLLSRSKSRMLDNLLADMLSSSKSTPDKLAYGHKPHVLCNLRVGRLASGILEI